MKAPQRITQNKKGKLAFFYEYGSYLQDTGASDMYGKCRTQQLSQSRKTSYSTVHGSGPTKVLRIVRKKMRRRL